VLHLLRAVESQEKLSNRQELPWMTLGIVILTALAQTFEPVATCFIYDRALIFKGEIWRIWTGHVVHFGASHFIWNLAVFLPAGWWLERLWPVLTRCFYGACSVVISIALLLLDPSLTRYAGLSGLATGMLVLLAALQLGRRKEEPAWFWMSVLILIGIKMGVELFTGAPVFVSGFGPIRTVPLAHVAGVVCGLVFWFGATLVKARV
jgi:rhomboid family GlyGly-CTERM serine protease